MPDGLQGPGAAGQLINGPDNLGLLLAGKGSLGDPADMNIMGYLDSSTARVLRVHARVHPARPGLAHHAHAVRRRDPGDIAKGLAAAKRNGDGTVTPDLTPADPTAYPIIDVSYLVADVEQASAAKAETLRSLIKFAVADGQKPAVLPPGYAPLPAGSRRGEHERGGRASPRRTLRIPQCRVRRPVAGSGAARLRRWSARRRPRCPAARRSTPGPASGSAKHGKAKVQAVADVHYPKAGQPALRACVVVGRSRVDRAVPRRPARASHGAATPCGRRSARRRARSKDLAETVTS